MVLAPKDLCALAWRGRQQPPAGSVSRREGRRGFAPLVSSLADPSGCNPQDRSERSEPEFTFRDPAGRLQLTETHALRRSSPSAGEETLAFLASPLRRALDHSGDLIPTEIAKSATHPSMLPGELWLEHPRIDPITYPWEWTTAQWRSRSEERRVGKECRSRSSPH